MDRHSGGGPPPHLRGRPVSGLEAAHAIEYFEPFLNATTLKNILGYHRSMCEFLHLKPNVFPHFYPKLRANLTSWRAKALWKKFDARASHKCYGKGKTCVGTRVLIIGGGPCGLRTAIEAQLLGAKVVVIEKRDRLSRNNVLHLWPFVIEDLRMLGAKKFFGKFCAGSIDHISIRQLQCILLKVALLLGVEVHTEVSFENLVEPNATEKTGWRADIKPENHPVSQYEFDVIIGADGKRNTLQGFKRKEFRGKLAIAITANFINKKTEAEARVEEISGVAFIFNQKFFKDLQEETRIDLENIVYYKDDTHYFVMTAKKASLLEKGVIKQDLADTEKLLAPDNVNRDALQNYAREAADFSTNYQLPNLEFAVNHYGQPDVAMFDFTSMYAAEYASKVVERQGHKLLMILVGDSLLEPFWPTGSGCARGFLSSLDAAWAIRSWSSGQMTLLDVLAERESIYRLLAQTTPDNLNKDWKSYTLDPSTRYPNLNKTVVTPHQTVCLYDTDNPDSIDKMKRASLEATNRQEHLPKKRRRGIVDKEALLNWLKDQLSNHEDITISDIASVFRDGKILCAIIHHYRPDLLDYSAVKNNEPAICNQLAMDILEKELGIPPFMTGEEITNTEDYLAMATYLTQVYDTFRGEIPHIKHPKLRLKSPSKISKSLLKPLPKSQSYRFKTELLEKLNIIEQKFSEITIITPNSPNNKFLSNKKRLEKGSGDDVPIVKDTKYQKSDNTAKGQKKISSDDLEIIDKSRKLKKVTKAIKKKSPIESRPVKTLSEKTFLTNSVGSFKNIKKKNTTSQLEIFDLTYIEEGISRRRKIKSLKPTAENILIEKIESSENIKNLKKNQRKKSLDVTEDKNLKKVKSRNVSISVNVSQSKDLKKKKLKLKKSKLSVIPENKEDTLNEKTRGLDKTKHSTVTSLEMNNSQSQGIENKVINNAEDNKKPPLKKVGQVEFIQSSEDHYKSISEQHRISAVKILRCETFVQNTFEDLKLPKIPSPVTVHNGNKIDVAKSVEISEDNKAKSEQREIKENEKYPLFVKTEEDIDKIINDQVKTPLSERNIKSKTKMERNKPRNVKKVLGLKHFNPLQLIRKHLLTKRAQLKSLLSKSNDPTPCTTKNLSNHEINIIDDTDQRKTSTDNNLDNNFNRIAVENKNNSNKSPDSSNQSIIIQVIHKSSSDRIICQGVEYKSSLNLIKITSRNCLSKSFSRTSKNLSQNNTAKQSILNICSPIRNYKTPTIVTSTSLDLYSSYESKTNLSSEKDKLRDNDGAIKNADQIFENRGTFWKDNLSSKISGGKAPFTPRLEKRRFPDFRTPKTVRIRRSKAGSAIKEKPVLTPVDAQIINSLGICAIGTSNFKKTCQQKFRSNTDLQKKQKFLFENNLRNSTLDRQKLIDDSSRADLKKALKTGTEKSKIKKYIGKERKELTKMDFYDEDETMPPQIYTRVQKWISQHDFKADELKKDPEGETLFTCDVTSDLTSITRAHTKKKGEYDDIKVEERTDVVKCESPISSSQEDFVELVKYLKDGKGLILKETKTAVKPNTKYSQFNMKSVSAPPANFSVIVEGEESELPENNKRSEFSFKSIKTTNHPPSNPNIQQSRPSSRHKRHAEVNVPKPMSIDRKQRKRRTLERIGPSVIYSRWFVTLVETVFVGLLLLIFDMYINPEEYIEPPASFLEYFWT